MPGSIGVNVPPGSSSGSPLSKALNRGPRHRAAGLVISSETWSPGISMRVSRFVAHLSSVTHLTNFRVLPVPCLGRNRKNVRRLDLSGFSGFFRMALYAPPCACDCAGMRGARRELIRRSEGAETPAAEDDKRDGVHARIPGSRLFRCQGGPAASGGGRLEERYKTGRGGVKAVLRCSLFSLPGCSLPVALGTGYVATEASWGCTDLSACARL